MPKAPFTTYKTQGLRPAIRPELWKTDSKRFAPGTYVAGLVLAQYTALTAVADVQTVTTSATGGTFRLQDPNSGLVTAAMPYNVTAAAMQTQMDALFGVGQTVVSGGPGSSAGLVVTFADMAAAAGPQAVLVVYSNNTTGGAGTVVVAHTTTGVGAGGLLTAYVNGGGSGTGVAKYICEMDGAVDTNGYHKFGDATFPSRKLSAPVVIGGYVRTADLTGIDSTAVGQLGRIVEGDVGNLTNTGTILSLI